MEKQNQSSNKENKGVVGTLSPHQLQQVVGGPWKNISFVLQRSVVKSIEKPEEKK